MGKLMGMRDELFGKLYTYLSLYTHPSNVSVFQFDSMLQNKKDFISNSRFNLHNSFFLVGVFIADYINFFPATLHVFEKMDLIEQIVINTFNGFARNYAYPINDAMEALID